MRTLIIVASILFTSTALGDWVSETKVTKYKVHNVASPYQLEIWFDKVVATSCTYSNRVLLSTTNSQLFESVKAVTTGAKASQRNLEVDTNGCEGNHGKLNYISLK